MTAPGALLAAATERLRRAGVDSPRVDAELLLAHCVDVARSRLALVDSVDAAQAAAFELLVQRRAAREPLQHLLGHAPFRYLDLAVGPGVFVPRPETELLVDAVLPTLRAATHPLAVDLCAGSGALALSLADELPGARVLAVECAPAALHWLRRNAAGAAVEVVNGDIRDTAVLAHLAGTVDAVVSNPPYVPTGIAVAPEVLADPAPSVFAGPDGLSLIPAVLARAAALLRPGGILAMEHDDSHADAVADLVRADPGWYQVNFHRDLTGAPRYLTAHRTDGAGRP